MIARQQRIALVPQNNYEVIGGNRDQIVKHEGQMYKGPDWFVAGANDDIYGGIYR
jgi:hypothetical protein